MSIEIVHPQAEKYAEKYASPPSALLQKIEEETKVHHVQAHMISGNVQGRLLSFLSSIAQPQYILEVGTFTGYSALCLAEGLRSDGMLHTIELREEDAILAKKYFASSQYADRIDVHIGNALDIIPTLPYLWDIVFIDADKVNYIAYTKLALERLRDNGFIIVDNVLFHGKVLEQPIKGKNPVAIQAFNDFIANNYDIEKVMLTVRDGLLLIKKKKNEF